MKYTYLLINLFTILIPLAMSFEKKIHFIGNIKNVAVAIFGTMVLFISWDIWFTAKGIWSFNPDYLTGLYIFNLPLEEWLFFITIPYALLFIYENIKTFVNLRKNLNFEHYFNAFLLVIFFVIMAYFKSNLYTFITFLLLSVYLVSTYIFPVKYNFKTAYLTYLIALIPFFIVNGLLTSLPVVIYDDTNNLGVRIFTIPVEDVFYGLLLFLLNLTIFEALRSKHQRI